MEISCSLPCPADGIRENSKWSDQGRRSYCKELELKGEREMPGDAFQTRCQLGDGSRSPGGIGSEALSLKQQKSGQEAVLVFRIGASHQATVK